MFYFLLAVFLFAPSASGQKFSSSSVTVTPNVLTYQTKCVCVSEPILIESIMSIDIPSISSISFSFVTVGPSYDGTSNACRLSTEASISSTQFKTIKIRYVVISNQLNFIAAKQIRVDKDYSGEYYMPSVNWGADTKTMVLVKGWSKEIVVLPTVTWNQNTIYASGLNNQNGWAVFTIVFYNSKLQGSWSARIFGNMTISNAPSVIYGYQRGNLPTTSSMSCDAKTCTVLLGTPGFYDVLGSLIEDSVYIQSQSQAEMNASPNWLMISLVSLSSLIFLLLLVPTIRYIRQYFWPQAVAPAADNPEGEESQDQIHINRIRFHATEKPVNYLPTKCCICLDNDSNCIVRPCGHNEFCENCIAYICRRKKQCSMCRTPIEQVEFFQVPLNCEVVQQAQ